uniref:Uncharacterized protein n=1 Tax=Haemonchus contortus TaxID=6289 RepID=A0A7I4YBC7_HAECO
MWRQHISKAISAADPGTDTKSKNRKKKRMMTKKRNKNRNKNYVTSSIWCTISVNKCPDDGVGKNWRSNGERKSDAGEDESK